VPSAAWPLATPPVRRYAKDHGVDLRTIAAGVNGRIGRADVDAALAGGRSEQARAGMQERERLSVKGIRRTIAEKMTTAHREIPAATAWVDADATRFSALRDDLRSLYPDRPLTYVALLLRLCVAGLRMYPVLNSRLDAQTGEIVLLDQVNIGFAATTPRGLLVPVVRDAQRLSLLDLADDVARLTHGARDGSLGTDDLSGGTFTVSSYGGFGVDAATPVINHPEAAILGAGRIVDRPWVHDGEVVARKVMTLVVSFDHRICDGVEAGGFLRALADLVERPERLTAVL
jgi:pyruvate dehydrogenase E2 component (dihydrolipoamide acetyltransferase)